MIKKYKKLSGLLVKIEQKWDKLCQYDQTKKEYALITENNLGNFFRLREVRNAT